jgi:hypothetical protein
MVVLHFLIFLACQVLGASGWPQTPSSMPIIKKDLQSERQIDKISHDGGLRRQVIVGILKRKTTAIEFVAPDEVNRKQDDKCRQQ